jgi:hypothetical protein
MNNPLGSASIIVIPTPGGDVRIDVDPTPDFLRENHGWPLGLASMEGETEDAPVRRVLQFYSDDDIVWGFKIQQSDFNEDDADYVYYCDRALIAAAIASLMNDGWRGSLVAGTYLRPKGELSEIGFVLFIFPPERPDRPAFCVEDCSRAAPAEDAIWATIKEFVAALSSRLIDTEEFPLHSILSVDPRPSTLMGYVAPMFMLRDKTLFALESRIVQDDSIWQILGQAGIKEVSWLPISVLHHETWEMR